MSTDNRDDAVRGETEALRLRCDVCDRPIANADEWEAFGPGEGPHLCWADGGFGNAHDCQANAVDWRARALAAEAAFAALASEPLAPNSAVQA